MRSSVQMDSMPMQHRLSFCSTTSSESNDGRSIEESISPMGIINQGIGDVGIRKQSPIISSLKRNGPNNVIHHSLTKISGNSSPVRKASTPTHSHRRYTAPGKILCKTASEGMLLDQQNEFTQLNRLDTSYNYHY